jgi:hypothetical protein
MERKMSKPYLLSIIVLLLNLTGTASQATAEVSVSVGEAGVDVNVGGTGIHVNTANTPPAIKFAAPPDVVVIPGTYVYMVPDIDADILFFQGYWWRPFEGRWYRSQDYDGQWNYMEPGRVPSGLRALPQDYHRRLLSGDERIHHGDMKRNWNQWEKEKHWDRRVEHDRRGQGEYDRKER